MNFFLNTGNVSHLRGFLQNSSANIKAMIPLFIFLFFTTLVVILVSSLDKVSLTVLHNSPSPPELFRVISPCSQFLFVGILVN